MNGNCHFIFGSSVGFATATLLSSSLINIDEKYISNLPLFTTCMVATCLIGSIFPDIDNPSSHMGQLAKPLSTLIGRVSALAGKKGSHHRGLFHDPFLYFLGLVLSIFCFLPMTGFFIGALSHLFLDCFNPSGIRMLGGYKWIRFAKIPSGSRESIILTWVFSVLCIITGICFLFYPNNEPVSVFNNSQIIFQQ